MTRGHGRLDPTAAVKDAGNRKLPALIYIHGGLVAGEKDVKHIYLSKFAEHGYFVVNIEYDLALERIFPYAIGQCAADVGYPFPGYRPISGGLQRVPF